MFNLLNACFNYKFIILYMYIVQYARILLKTKLTWLWYWERNDTKLGDISRVRTIAIKNLERLNSYMESNREKSSNSKSGRMKTKLYEIKRYCLSNNHY